MISRACNHSIALVIGWKPRAQESFVVKMACLPSERRDGTQHHSETSTLSTLTIAGTNIDGLS